ncbi:gliding motility-associated C-terminal domain-containing protein [Pontibacter populi]|uniref:Gliding motility-associated C-terminal domain-containing protein n=1 Tax=Pontibacter populi TaxID=890055 RepID=A0ABV1RNN0_9BACT
MRILLPLLLTLSFFGFLPSAAFSQCQPPSVVLPDDISYCGPRGIAFTTTNPAHTPVYSNDALTYSWKLNGVVVSTTAYPTINFPTPGTHNVTVTVTKRCGRDEIARAEDTQFITIEAIPAAPDVDNLAVCTGSNATLWVNNADPNLIYKWYNKSNGALLVWGTSYTMNNASYMQVEVEAITASGCTSPRTTATITSSLTNGNATVLNGDQEICAGTKPQTIDGNAPQNMTFQWLMSTTGAGSGYSPIASATDKSYSPPPLYQTTWYKRVAYNGGCGEETNPVKVTVTAIPSTPIVSDRLVCYGERAMFVVSNSDGNTIYNWYATATSTTMLGTGPTFITPQPVTGPVTYYVEATTTAQTQCYNLTRIAVNANATPAIANNSISANQAMCTGGKPQPLIGTTPTGGGGGYIYQWQQSTDGNTFTDVQGANAKDFAPASLKITTWFRRTIKAASSCPMSISNIVVVTVTPMPATIDIDDPMICYGSPASIVVTNPEPDFTYRWYDVAEGGTLLATGTTYTTTPLTSNKTYYVEATSDAGCYSVRRSVEVTVTALPGVPTAANVTICEGTNAILAVEPTDAAIFYRWYDSNNILVATGINYSIPPLTVNTTYYVEAVTKASPGCASPKVAVEVTVTPKIASNTISADQVICSGATPAPLQGTVPTGGGGGYTYQWEYSVDGSLFNTITGATGTHYAPAALTTTTWYRRKVNATGSCKTSISNLVKITVNQLPGTPTATNTSICTGSETTLAVNSPDANLTYKWYTTPTGGSAIATGSTYNTGILTSGKIYYIEATSATGCVSPTRGKVSVTVIPLPATPEADNASVCAGATVTLKVLAPDANLVYRWYNDDTDGTLLATGTNYTTEALSESSIFYVEASTVEGCTSSDRKPVYVNVTPLPAIPDVSNTTICSGDAAVLFVKNPDPTATYHWYLGGSLLASGVTFTTDILAYSTTYHVEAVSNTTTACPSPARRAVVVTVTPNIANNNISSEQTICSGGTPSTLTGTQPTGGSGTYTYQWERSEDGTNFSSIAGAVNSTYSPGSLTITTWFRRKVKATTGSCPEHVSNPVKVTVSPQPTTPTALNTTVCFGERAQLSVSTPDPSLTYKWYSTASGGSPVGVGATLLTETLTATTTYYVDATSTTGCTSNRRAVTATVRPLPEMPQALDKTICAGSSTTLSVTNPNPTLAYRWFNASGDQVATGTTFTTAALQTTTTYYVEASTVTNPVCTSTRKAVVVSVTPIPGMPAAENVAICTGGSAVLTVTSPDVSLTYNWYTSATGGSAIGTGTSYNTGTLTSARSFYLEAVTAAGCVSPRSKVDVTVTPLPATPTADNVSICAGAPATLSVKDPVANVSYRWYTAATGGTLLATGNSYAIGSVATTTTYYIEAVTAGGCASTSRGTVTVQVTPLPATPNADNATVCAGNSTTLWVKNPEPGLIYRWYQDGVQVATGISYTTEVLNYSATYQLEAVTNNSNACVSASRRTVSVTVTPAISNNIISADQNICSGTAPVTFTGTLPAGDGSDFSYQWERSEDGVNFSIIANATAQSYTSGALNATSWFRRRVKSNNNCPEHISNVVKVTINSLPSTPLADNTTTCEGSTATLSVKDPNSAYTYRWYTVATGGSILGVGTTITTPAVTTSTTYYVEASNATGCLSPRKAVTVSVTPLPISPVVKDRSICVNEQAILSVSSPSATLIYRWYNSAGNLLATGPTYTTDALSANTVYYVDAATIATPSCVSNRSTVIVSVMPLPATPQANDATVCSGNTADLAVKDVDPNLTYKWYSTANGGTALHTGSTYRTTTLTSGRTYYIEAVNAAGCISLSRKAVTVNVIPIPSAPVVNNTTICAGSSATLNITAPDASLTYHWYDNAGNLLGSGTSFNTGALSSTTNYSVEAVALATTGCNSTRRTVTVTVTPLPAKPEVNQPTICAGATATLVVENPVPSVNYNWYDGNENLITTGTSFTTDALTESTLYYVEAVTSNGCASPAKEVVTVKVLQPVSNNAITADQTICYASTPTALTGSEPMGGGANYSYQWEKSEDGLNFTTITGATTQNYTPEALTTDTWFRRKVVTDGPCKENNSNIVKITVTPLPAVPTAANATICAGSSANLSITGAVANYTYRWFNAASGGTVLRSGATFTTPELQATTTYYVEAINEAGCVSPRRAVTVTVTPMPGAPVVANQTICSGNPAVLSVSAPNQSLVYKWYNSIGEQVASGSTYNTGSLTTTTTYYVEAATTSAPFCVSSRSTVVVTVTDLPTIPVVENTSVCAGEAATLSVLVVDPAYTYKWYTSATGGTVVGSGATYNTGALTSNRTYYVEAVSAAGCASQRATIAVTVTPLPATPSADNVSICAGQPATLAVNAPDANLSFRWYNAATDGTLLATGDTYTTNSLSVSETFYVEAVTATGCASTTRKAVTVNVTPLPATPVTENASICAGSGTTLWVKNPDPTVYYNWYSGGALVGTGISYATGVLNYSATYYVEAISNTGTACSSATRSTVTVTVTPAISNNFISADQTICSGSLPATITGSLPNGGGGNYSYQWERSEDGVNFTAISNATTQNYSPSALNITTWCRRKVKAVGPCGEQVSNTIQIAVQPIPATPVADNATICAGATATLSVKDVTPGYTYRWYTTPTGGSAIVTGISFTTTSLESTTTYYVEAVNATGCISSRRTVSVTVMPLPEAPMVADQNICAGEQAILAVENQTTSLTYRWYDSNGTLLATGTSYTTATLNSNTTYYVEAVTSGTLSCASARTIVAVNVATRPSTPLADNSSVCAGSSAQLSVKSIVPGITYKWYTVATGGTPVFIGSAYTTAALTSNRTYYVEASTASGCTSESRKAVTVTVIQQPAMPVVADQTICQGSEVVLTVANPDANLMYRWYNQGGTALATGTSYTARGLTANTMFYVEAVTTTSPGCVSARETVYVTVTPSPATPLADDAKICAGSTATLYVKNATPAVVYKWYDDTETLLHTGTTFTTPVLTADAIYYIEASSGAGCVNPGRTVATVYVAQPIVNNTISGNQTICSGTDPSTLIGYEVMSTDGIVTYQWESSEDGINYNIIPTATGKNYKPATTYVTTWYRRTASVENGTCPAQKSNIVKISVISAPATPLASNITICAGSRATLSVTSPELGYTYRWFSVASGGNSLGSGIMFTADGLQTETTYYVEAVNAGGCVSARKAVTVYVTPLPAIPQASDQVICYNEKTTLSVTNPNVKLNYRWFDGNGTLVANGSSFTTANLKQNTMFYVEAYTTTTQACASQRKAVMVSVMQLPTAPEVDNRAICEGSGTTLTVKQAAAGLTYKWYSAATGGLALATGTTYETGSLTSDRTYYVEATNTSGCVSERTPVTVTISALPATPIASNQQICAGETVTLRVSQPDATLNYRWFSESGKLLATGNTHSISGLTASTTYYVEAVNAAGCISPKRQSVVVSVTQLPGTPFVSNASICSGEKVTLYVKNPDPTVDYRWYNDAAGTNLIGSGISYTSSDALFSTRSYYVEAVNTAGCSSPTRAQAIVSVTAKPGAPVVEDAMICSGGTAKLEIIQPDPALVYKWYDANGTMLHTGTTYTTFPLSSQATFYVRANTTSPTACAGPSEAVTVSIMSSLANNTVTGNQTICSGATPAPLSGTVPTGGGNATLAYQWERSEDGVNFVSIVGAYAQEYAPGALTQNTWFRRVVRAAGPCGESVSNAIMVTVTPLPATPLADDVTVCAGSTATLRIKNPSTGASNITYRWYYTASGGTSIASGINFTTQPLYTNTTYYVEAVNATGCASSARRAVTITVNQLVTDNTISSAQQICTGSIPAALTGSVAFQQSENYTYQWQQSPDGINYMNISGATGQHYAPTQALTKNVWYRRVVQISGPCEDHISNAVKMEVVPLPTLPSIASVSVCPGGSATLQATGVVPGTRLEWFDAPTGGTYIAEGTTLTVTPYSTTTYWVQAVNSSNCESSARREVKVTVVNPVANVSGDVTIMQGKATKLVATGGATYSWSPATGLSDPTSATPIAKPEVTTTYTVTITTAEGCTASASVTVNVVPAIIPMNAMTPNGDGINDVFHVENLELYPDSRVEIFTRWGEKIFESKGYSEPWNGMRNGKPMPLGAYYYIIYLSRDEAPISGSITIIK